jgi:hypothetical protein
MGEQDRGVREKFVGVSYWGLNRRLVLAVFIGFGVVCPWSSPAG